MYLLWDFQCSCSPKISEVLKPGNAKILPGQSEFSSDMSDGLTKFPEHWTIFRIVTSQCRRCIQKLLSYLGKYLKDIFFNKL